MIALLAGAAILSSPELGTAAGRCRPDEPGPAVLVTVAGLKDRRGLLRLELYPPDDADFLADDDKLLAAAKDFARVDVPTPAADPVTLCIRAPRAGRFALALLHDRNGDRRFHVTTDGVGFPGNPVIGLGKPHAAAASLDVGPGVSRTRIVVNYWRGFRMRPLDR